MRSPTPGRSRKLPKMRSVAEEAPPRSTIHWLTRPRGIQWQPAIEAVRGSCPQAKAWRRQMVLGPAAEFVVETPAEAEIDVPVGWQTSPRLAKTKRTSVASNRAGASGAVALCDRNPVREFPKQADRDFSKSGTSDFAKSRTGVRLGFRERRSGSVRSCQLERPTTTLLYFNYLRKCHRHGVGQPRQAGPPFGNTTLLGQVL